MEHYFYSNLPKEGKALASIYWLKSLLDIEKHPSIDEFLKTNIFEENLSWQDKQSLRRFLFRKQNGNAGTSSVWFHKINELNPDLLFILEHPLWDLITNRKVDQMYLTCIKERANSYLGALSQKHIPKLGINIHKPVTRAQFEKLVSKPSLSSLALLCVLKKERFGFNDFSLNMEVDFYIEHTFQRLVLNTPLRHVTNAVYSKMKQFLNLKVSYQ